MGTYYTRYERIVAKKSIEKLLGEYVLVKDANDYDKAFIFANNHDLLKRFTFNINCLQREDYDYCFENWETLDKIKTEYKKFKKSDDPKQSDIMSNVLYVKNNLDFFETYPYAKYIISEYVKSDKNISTKDFYKGIGIDKKVFNYCIANIEELDVDLYKEYLQVEEERKEVDKAKNISVINDMIYGIKNGQTRDGKIFDVAECLKMMPFKYDKKFLNKVQEFMVENEIEDELVLLSYLSKNNIHNDAFTKPFDPSIYYNTKLITNGKILVNEDYDEILDYMDNNHYPKSYKVFDALLNRKVKDVLNTNENEKGKTLKITLIPSNKQ